jgi:hypothetical protein
MSIPSANADTFEDASNKAKKPVLLKCVDCGTVFKRRAQAVRCIPCRGKSRCDRT